jgi:DNA-binding protein HU-beta
MMTKADMIDQMVKLHGENMTKKMAGEILDNTFQLMSKSIKKDKKFSYPGFGTFMLRTRKARKGRNPQTGAVINIKASKTVGFRPAKALKDSL